MSNSFITNKDKYLSDIINGILPKTSAVDFLVGYFYYSGYKQLSDQLKDKHVRILVGLDIDIRMAKYVCEVENFRQHLQSRGVLKDEYYGLYRFCPWIAHANLLAKYHRATVHCSK